jgi:hypothetical protein
MGPETCRLRLGHGSALGQHSKELAKLLDKLLGTRRDASDPRESRQVPLVYHELVESNLIPAASQYKAIAAARDAETWAEEVPHAKVGGDEAAPPLYVHDWGQLFVPVEICQSSNMYLLPPKAVTSSDAPLARFIHHGVPVVLATDNDGVMRMVDGGHHQGKSVLSEMWRAVLRGHFAPHEWVPGPLPRPPWEAAGSKTTLVCSDQHCAALPDRRGLGFWKATQDSVDNVLACMSIARFGLPFRGRRSSVPSVGHVDGAAVSEAPPMAGAGSALVRPAHAVLRCSGVKLLRWLWDNCVTRDSSVVPCLCCVLCRGEEALKKLRSSELPEHHYALTARTCTGGTARSTCRFPPRWHSPFAPAPLPRFLSSRRLP